MLSKASEGYTNCYDYSGDSGSGSPGDKVQNLKTPGLYGRVGRYEFDQFDTKIDRKLMVEQPFLNPGLEDLNTVDLRV